MPTAAHLIRPNPEFRRSAVLSGLHSCGYRWADKPLTRPNKDDILVIWNRSPVADRVAIRYEQCGATVLVMENGYLGREWRGGYWYALARSKHNGAGKWPAGDNDRWDRWGIELAAWRTSGDEIVILAQRGIGQRDIREPSGWVQQVVQELKRRTSRPIRVRMHPGEDRSKNPLEADLKSAWACITWSSGAGLKAIAMGVPVFSGCPTWIGKTAALPITSDLERPFRGDRLPMFRRLAWAMWNVDEIASGVSFRCLQTL